jgi:hypothetical protein
VKDVVLLAGTGPDGHGCIDVVDNDSGEVICEALNMTEANIYAATFKLHVIK